MMTRAWSHYTDGMKAQRLEHQSKATFGLLQDQGSMTDARGCINDPFLTPKADSCP